MEIGLLTVVIFSAGWSFTMTSEFSRLQDGCALEVKAIFWIAKTNWIGVVDTASEVVQVLKEHSLLSVVNQLTSTCSNRLGSVVHPWESIIM